MQRTATTTVCGDVLFKVARGKGRLAAVDQNGASFDGGVFREAAVCGLHHGPADDGERAVVGRSFAIDCVSALEGALLEIDTGPIDVDRPTNTLAQSDGAPGNVRSSASWPALR